MATKLTKPVVRETNVIIQGRELILTMMPGGFLSLREKGGHTSFDVSIEAVFHLAVRQAVAATKGGVAKKSRR